MNILFLSAWYPWPHDNGSKIRVYNLIKALSKRHGVTLLAFAFDTAKPPAREAAGSVWVEEEVVSANPFERSRLAQRLRFISPMPIVCRPVREMGQRVNRRLATGSYAAVIASTEVMANYALQAQQPLLRVLEEHNSTTRWMHERYVGENRPLRRQIAWASWLKHRRYEARLLPQFDLCTMVSHQDVATSQQLSQQLGQKVKLVPNGVDCAKLTMRQAEGAPKRLIFNGSLTYSANYDAMRYFLAEIYPLIRQQLPQAVLTITGSVAKVDLAQLQLDGSVCLTGWVDDVYELVARATVCVAPIRQGGGTRLKILEAMALGTPVVATSKGAEGLAVTAGRDILIADEPAEFAACVLRLLKDTELRRQLATQARRLVEERYDWSAIGADFTQLVEAVADRKQAEYDLD